MHDYTGDPQSSGAPHELVTKRPDTPLGMAIYLMSRPNCLNLSLDLLGKGHHCKYALTVTAEMMVESRRK